MANFPNKKNFQTFECECVTPVRTSISVRPVYTICVRQWDSPRGSLASIGGPTPPRDHHRGSIGSGQQPPTASSGYGMRSSAAGQHGTASGAAAERELSKTSAKVYLMSLLLIFTHFFLRAITCNYRLVILLCAYV